MSTPEANWYPDPSNATQLRWWDGQSWTSHVQPMPVEQTSAAPAPAAQAPAAPAPAAQAAAAPADGTAPAKKKSRTPLLIGLGVGAVVIALVVSLTVVAINWLSPMIPGSLPTTASAVSGHDYLMTEPMLDRDPQSKFSFPAPYDFEARYPSSITPETRRNGDATQEDAFELFLDPSLTARSSLSIYQSKPGAELWITPSESNSLTGAGSTSTRVAPRDWSWGLEPEYYLVRHVDENGDKLDKSVVTRITSRAPELASPHVRAEPIADTGAVKLSWDAVPGATGYVVISSHSVVTDDSKYRFYSAYGTVKETSWSSEGDLDQFDPSTRQNVSMVLFNGQSADQLMAQGTKDADEEAFKYETGDFRWGVVATDGTHYSRAGSLAATGLIDALPYEVARYTMDLGVFSGSAPDPAALPQQFAFTGLDGRTRATRAYIADDGITVENDSWEVQISGAGTLLKAPLTWLLPRGQQVMSPQEFIAAYNAGAEKAFQPTTGMESFVVLSGTLEEVAADAVAAAEPAKVDYPVYGSDDFVKFLAGHFIAGSELIDVTKYAEAPGAQALWDAIQEANYQNPYVVGLDLGKFRESYSGDRRVIRAAYDIDKGERMRLQKLTADHVASVVKQVVKPGMTARDTAVALNDWLAANTAYDYGALAMRDAVDRGEQVAHDKYSYAWRPDGVFEHGTVVCGGYAITYAALMNQAGVETVVVTGDVLSGGRHAWNKVKVDGAWLSVDTTWNDGPAGNRYLLIKDSQFTGQATRTEDPYWIRDDLVSSFKTP
ncbi:MAG: hypothetical protein BGN97_09200 [Microbacterium sp. 69-10]|uniref:DUF2510 domain-containing protein n=1 Tax=Micrococcales TaxID=85006 RepID=UPI0009682760|nr:MULTISPECIES: DUF2510 domain-containing protein [Micrococcales]OJU42507.1 MAG: hypothetical protein BGN97_09200 [Microbacterium sp. 69-10]